MNSLFPVLMILGSLHGAPVKIDLVTQEEDPTDVPAASSQILVSSLGLPRASSADWLSVESTVLSSKLEAGETGFTLQLPGEFLTTAEGFADELSRPSQASPGHDGEESTLALSKRTGVVIGLRVPTTLADTVYSHWTSPKALDFTSTGHILPPSSTVSGRSDHEVTTSLFQFASQPAFTSEGTTTLDRKDNSQNTPPPNSTRRSDAMQSLTESSVDGIITRGLTPFESIESSPQSLPSTAVPSSLGSETAPVVRLRTGAVSWDSTFEELSNSTSIESAGPSSSSESWQDAPEDEPTTSVSISCSPGVSDMSSAASFASITPAPDVGEANSTAALHSFPGATDVSMSSVASLSPDVTNALSSTLLALSQAGYTTSVSIAQDPDVPYLFTSQTPVDPVASPTAPPASGQWLSDVSEYSTALSVSVTEALGLSRLLPASQSPETSAYSTTASVSADWFSDASEDPAASRVSTAHVPYTAATHSTAEAVYSDPTLSVTDSYSTSWSPSDAFSSVSAQQLSDVVDYSTTHRAADHSERSTFALLIASGSTAVSVPCSATPCVSTLASEIPTSDALVSSWPSAAPEHTVASSVSLVQDFGISDTYPTSASVYSEQSSDVSDRSHNPDVSTYSMSSPSVLTDVSEYSTAPSSLIHLTPDNSASSTAFVTNDVLDVPVATSRTPDVSDTYSTAVSGDSTQWQSDVSDYSSALSVTSWSLDVWLAGNSKVGTTMVSPHTQQTTRIKATSTEMPGSERHASVSLTHTSPLSSATLSSTPIWKPFPSEKLFTTSCDDPSTRSPTSIRLSPSTSQPFTKATAIGTIPGTSAFVFELSETASLYSQTARTTPGIQAPLLLQFAILNQNYSYSLSDRSSEDYKELEAVVDRTLRAIFHARYRDNFLGIEILGFRNGSVRVECEVVFQVKADVPSSSDIVRTILTHVYRQGPSELVLDASSVACNGYSLANLQPEELLIEFTALSVGFGPWTNKPMFLPDLLQRLSSWVVATLEEKYFVQEFNIGRVISIQGDVNIQGTALLSTPVHVDNAEVLTLLNDLVNRSVDLRSLRVNGSAMNLGVLPVSFAIESHEYNTTLRDSRSAYFCRLGGAVTRALQAILKPRYSNFVQAVVSHFGRHGSVISTCDLMFLNAAPASREVLDIFFNLVNGNGFLMGMDIKVDAYSFTVGDARLERPYQPIHFPGFGIALILLFSLAVVSLPAVALLCWKYSFWTTCQEGFLRQQWDLEQNTSLHLPLPEVSSGDTSPRENQRS